MTENIGNDIILQSFTASPVSASTLTFCYLTLLVLFLPQVNAVIVCYCLMSAVVVSLAIIININCNYFTSLQQSNLDPFRAQVGGSTLLQSIQEIVIPCTFPIVYSTNQTIGANC